MTLINIQTLSTELGGPEPVSATLTATYWAGRKPYIGILGESIIFPTPITVEFVEGEEVEPIEMAPTGAVACVRWVLRTAGAPALEIYTSIPDEPEIDFADLPVVDKMTFLPAPNTPSVQEILADAVSVLAAAETAIEDANTAIEDANTAITDAETTLTQAATSATNAGTSATAAAGSATAAAGSATAAAGSATAAASSATAAAGSATAAAGSATSADTRATDANTAATAATAARDETIVSVAAQSDITGSVTLSQSTTKSAYLRRRLTGNTTLTLSAGVAGQAYSCTLELQQDATGNRTIIFANVATSYGAVVPLSTTANSVDLIHLLWNGTVWRAFLAGTQLGIPASWVV